VGEELVDEKEMKVVDLLAESYNAFTELPVLHPNDHVEFVQAIHAAQNIVMARLAVKAHPKVFNVGR
jgi:hypothetical protein